MWTAYELFLNIYEGFLYTWFISSVLAKKKDCTWPFITCALLTAAALSSYLFFPMPSWDTWTFGFVLLYSLIFLEGPVIRKLYWNMILIVVTMSVIGISYQVFQTFLNADTDILLESGNTRIFFTLAVNAILAASLFLVSRFFKEKGTRNSPSYLLLSTVLLCVILIDIFFHLVNQYSLPLIWLFTGCLISLVIGLVTLVTNRLIIRYTRHEEEYLYQEELLHASERQLNELKDVYDSTLKLRHDIYAYVNDIQKMMSQKNISQAAVYLDEMEKHVLPLYSTGNQMLDSVLTAKVSKINSSQVEFRGTNLHYTGGMNIQDVALCSLVSNMLDNALEAMLLRREQPGEHYISFGFYYSLTGLMIICENPLLGIPPKTEKGFFSSKKKDPYHGLGISIMERIAEEASGQLEVTLYEDTFRVLAIIPPVDSHA